MAYFPFLLDRFHRISVRDLNSISPGPREHLSGGRNAHLGVATPGFQWPDMRAFSRGAQPSPFSLCGLRYIECYASTSARGTGKMPSEDYSDYSGKLMPMEYRNDKGGAIS